MLFKQLARLLLLASLCCLRIQSTSGQTPSINYAIAIERFREFYNNRNADSLYRMYSIQMKAALSVESNKQFVESMYQQMGKLLKTEFVKQESEYALFVASFEKEKNYLIFPLNQKNELNGLRFQPYQEPKQAKEYQSNIYTITEKGDTVFGTKTLAAQDPKGGKTILIIAGSGPTDRDGNNHLGVSAQSYKMLADSLNHHGYAVVRYDKRGIAQSKGKQNNEKDLRFEQMVDDAVSFIREIKKTSTKVYIIGHSEGSLVAMLAAQKEPVNGFISLAGMGSPADKLLLEQMDKQMDKSDVEDARSILESLKAGKTVQVENPRLQMMFHSGVQPYLISFLRYNPEKEMAKVPCPALIVQGTTDIQVEEKEATYLHKAKPDAKMVIIEGMNHVLKESPRDRDLNLATYTNPDLPIPSKLIKELVAFLNTTL